eukprot:c12310_g1_i1 orf=438-1187(+)
MPGSSMERSSAQALYLPQTCFIMVLLFPACKLFGPLTLVSCLPLARGISTILGPQDTELWCESCVISCEMGDSFSSCDEGAFYTSIFNGRLGFEVWMHAPSTANISNQSFSVVEQKSPTAYIDAGPAFTNAVNLTVKILFDAQCMGEGFQCPSASTCDLLVTGDGVVLPSTLQSSQGGLLLSLTVALHTKSPTGKVMLALVKGLCMNFTGNSAKGMSGAVVTIRFGKYGLAVCLVLTCCLMFLVSLKTM